MTTKNKSVVTERQKTPSKQPTSQLSDEELLVALKKLERFAELTDSQFRIPGTKIRFGLDAIIGLVPVIGDAVGLVLSLYLLMQANKLGVPAPLKMKMLRNVGIDWVVGLIPLLGDVFDVAFKANVRNQKLLAEYLTQEYQARHPALGQQKKSRRFTFFYGLLVSVLVALSIYAVFMYYQINVVSQ